MTFSKKLLDVFRDKAAETTVNHISIGLGYTAVVASDDDPQEKIDRSVADSLEVKIGDVHEHVSAPEVLRQPSPPLEVDLDLTDTALRGDV